MTYRKEKTRPGVLLAGALSGKSLVFQGLEPAKVASTRGNLHERILNLTKVWHSFDTAAFGGCSRLRRALLPALQFALDRLADESGHALLPNQIANSLPHLFRQANLRRFVSERRASHAWGDRRYRKTFQGGLLNGIVY